MKRTSAFFIGLLAGTATAATAVLLTTPQSGEQLRRSMKETATDFKMKMDDVAIRLLEVKVALQHLGEEAKTVLPETFESLKQSVEKWQDSTAPNQERLESELTSIQNALEDLERQLADAQKKSYE